VLRYRAAESKDDIKGVVDLLVGSLFFEAGLAPISPQKMLSRIWEIAENRLLYVIEAEDGSLIGSLAFVERDIWYSDQTCLIDNWFFLLPEYRNGPAAQLMIQCAQGLANEGGVPVMISITNPRRSRPKPFARWVENDKFLLYPLGSTMVIGPTQETRENVLRRQATVLDDDVDELSKVAD
jgi:hypothetical protein